MQFTQAETDAARRLAEAILVLAVALQEGARARHPPPVPRAAEPIRPPEPIPPPPAPKAVLLTAREAAEYLSVSTGTLSNRTQPKGLIPSVRIGACRRYAISDLDAAIERYKVRK